MHNHSERAILNKLSYTVRELIVNFMQVWLPEPGGTEVVETIRRILAEAASGLDRLNSPLSGPFLEDGMDLGT